MQDRQIGGIGDFGKLALLRHLMKDRRLSVCWYLTAGWKDGKDSKRHFDFLNRPNEYRHLAPEVFDALLQLDGGWGASTDRLTKLHMSRILGNAVFLRQEVPIRAPSRRQWLEVLVESVRGTNLVFLDPDYGIEGKRLTAGHVALAEIAALKTPGRALIIGHQQSGRRSEVRFLAEQVRSLGCSPIEIVRLRLVSSRFYVIADHDSAMSELLSTFVKKWGDRIKCYRA